MIDFVENILNFLCGSLQMPQLLEHLDKGIAVGLVHRLESLLVLQDAPYQSLLVLVLVELFQQFLALLSCQGQLRRLFCRRLRMICL